MKSLNIIIIALLAIIVTGFIFVISIADLQAPTINDTNTNIESIDEADDIEDTDTLKDGYLIFESTELGIKFEYPEEWGELSITINDNTPGFPLEDSNENWRKEALISIPDRGIMMSTYTGGENMGRGGYWADYVVRTQSSTTLNELCNNLEDPTFAVQPSDSCSNFTNLAGIDFAQLNGSTDWYGEITNNVDLYLANHPDSEYYGVAFSTQDLAIDGEVPQEVSDQIYRVVMSLEYID